MTSSSGTPSFFYANRDNAWLDFQRHNLDVVNGSLQLTGLPGLSAPLPPELARMTSPDGPAGIAVAPDGVIFYSVPDQHRVYRVDPCDASEQSIPCLGGAGSEPTQLSTPRGLAVHPGRQALIVADAGNHRLQFFDLATFQLVDIWGDDGSGGAPAPSDEPGRFDSPTDVAVGGDGCVYVVDAGNRRVQQFTAGGVLIPAFWERLSTQVAFGDPVNIATVTDQGGEAICILDREHRFVLVCDPDANVIQEVETPQAEHPLGLAVSIDAIFVGDTGTPGRILSYQRYGRFLGPVLGWAAPVAALALDGAGHLLVHPGLAAVPVVLTLNAAFVRSGLAWGGPFGRFTNAPKAWHSLRAAMPPLPADAHVRFYIYVTDDPAADLPDDRKPTDHFPTNVWWAAPDDLDTFLIERPDTQVLWIGVECQSEGGTSPRIEQIRVEFDHDGYEQYLPAIFSEDAPDDAFLPRYLALVESLFNDVEAETAGLNRLLDPIGAPDAFVGQLARWLGLDIASTWSEAELRDAITHAYDEAAMRGTARGLRAAVHRSTGADVSIEEPIVQAGWWALADEESPLAEQSTSLLGVSTMLVAAEPQGAVLGSTATVNRAHLIGDDEYGSPLFEGLAHRFMVRLNQGGQLTDARLRAISTLIEREKPAHTDYQLCLIEPRFEIGQQSRIGIDAVVGGETLPTRMPAGDGTGVDMVLGGEPPGRIGERSEIGVTTLLGPAAVGD